MAEPTRKVQWAEPPAEMRLTRRHEIVAALDAIGWSRVQIARFMGYKNTVSISQIRKSEKYRRAVDALAARAQTQIVEKPFEIVRRIAEDAEENFKFLKSTRDNTSERIDQRVKVGIELLDRQAPKRTPDDRPPGVHVHFDMRDMKGMREALAEEGFPVPEAIEGEVEEEVDEGVEE